MSRPIRPRDLFGKIEELERRLSAAERQAIQESQQPGGTGDKSYTHTQTTADATWTVNHGLGKMPAVEIIDSAGSYLLATVEYTNLNSLLIKFAGATAGTAYLN